MRRFSARSGVGPAAPDHGRHRRPRPRPAQPGSRSEDHVTGRLLEPVWRIGGPCSRSRESPGRSTWTNGSTTSRIRRTAADADPRREQGKRPERAGKPNSVPRFPGAAIIPLGPRSPSGSSSRPGDGPPQAGRDGRPPSPYLALLRMGFAVPPPLPAGRCALTAPFHPYRPPERSAGGLFSVALSFASPRPGVTRHAARLEFGLSSPISRGDHVARSEPPKSYQPKRRFSDAENLRPDPSRTIRGECPIPFGPRAFGPALALGSRRFRGPWIRRSSRRAFATSRRGYSVVLADNIRDADGFLAGSDESRASGYRRLVIDPSVDAIFFARGGYGSSRILSRLDCRRDRSEPQDPSRRFGSDRALRLARPERRTS